MNVEIGQRAASSNSPARGIIIGIYSSLKQALIHWPPTHAPALIKFILAKHSQQQMEEESWFVLSSFSHSQGKHLICESSLRVLTDDEPDLLPESEPIDTPAEPIDHWSVWAQIAAIETVEDEEHDSVYLYLESRIDNYLTELPVLFIDSPIYQPKVGHFVHGNTYRVIISGNGQQTTYCRQGDLLTESDD